MLAIHWSPVKNTKLIRRKGIRKSNRGLYCFPLTGHHNVDRWWAQFFRSCRPRTQYNGFVFKIVQDDMPAMFGHWISGEMFNSLDELKSEFRSSIIWRIGEEYLSHPEEDFTTIGSLLISENPKLYSRIQSDPNWMRWVFEDYQIVLSRSIDAKRILRIVSGSQASGRQRVRKYRTKDFA
jgi:hypothetical protein